MRNHFYREFGMCCLTKVAMANFHLCWMDKKEKGGITCQLRLFSTERWSGHWTNTRALCLSLMFSEMARCDGDATGEINVYRDLFLESSGFFFLQQTKLVRASEYVGACRYEYNVSSRGRVAWLGQAASPRNIGLQANQQTHFRARLIVKVPVGGSTCPVHLKLIL